jgi:cyclopropane-fatty-acyl-phospholipid synthase
MTEHRIHFPTSDIPERGILTNRSKVTINSARPFGPARIDAQLWPDVAVVPRSPVRAAIARRLFHGAALRLPIRVVEDGGKSYGGGTALDPVMRMVRPSAFYQRVGATGTIGFGEAYMAGDWTAEDLSGVLTAFAANMRNLIPSALHRLRFLALRTQPAVDDNTVEGSAKNIQRHYDLSNDMFREFLDESMTYSSALWDGNPATSTDELETAQRRKINRLLDAAHVGAGTRLLEIGTGWGELAIQAAQRGAQVTSITLSHEQAALARTRIHDAGLDEQATVLLQDYRHTSGEFDAIVSVEMIEAVGMPHWPEYFSTIDQLLAPGGRVGIQAILQEDDRVRATSETYTWVRKYIFPGGQLPSVEAIEQTLTAHTALHIVDQYSFGAHYAETLRRWRDRFEARTAEISRLGFDETFKRMWSLYLDVSQMTFAKPAIV